MRAGAEPVSATSLAKAMGVSRQIIVGDIALLRAQGKEITATARGYTMAQPQPGGRYVGKLACQHSFEDTGTELRAIVRAGGEVLDVVVEHDLYGEITGQLNVATEEDVELFLRKLQNNETRLLSELTGGVHLHTVACRDAAAFARIKAELCRLNLMYRSN